MLNVNKKNQTHVEEERELGKAKSTNECAYVHKKKKERKNSHIHDENEQ